MTQCGMNVGDVVKLKSCEIKIGMTLMTVARLMEIDGVVHAETSWFNAGHEACSALFPCACLSVVNYLQ